LAAIKLANFGGMMPAWDPHLLPEGQATAAQNGYLYSGSLEGWRKPKFLRALQNSAALLVYRILNRDTNDSRLDAPDSKWLEFDDIDTKIVRTPVVDDQFQRYYFASPSTPPQYNSYDRILNNDPPWLLGIPQPKDAPTATVQGGGDAIQLGNTIGVFVEQPPVVYVVSSSISFTRIAPTGSLLLVDVSFLSAQDSTTGQFRAALYDDLNGVPYQLIAASGTTTYGAAANVPVVCPFDTPPTLDQNVVYWIAVLNDKDYYAEQASTTLDHPPLGWTASCTFTNPPPNFPSSAVSQTAMMMLADLTGQGIYAARAYVYTWISSYNEQGPPSPPLLFNGWSNGVWTIELPSLPDPLDQGVQRTIDRKRLYRTVTSTTGVTSYYLVAEMPIAQTEYVDSSQDNDIALNELLASFFWFPPPDDLQGFVAYTNGMTVGWRSNEVWFSEIYRPHAWPPGYVLTTEFPVVGLGVSGQSIIVCTEGNPYVLQGVLPNQMAAVKVLLPEPCINPGSIVSTDTVVMYHSPNGLVEVDQSGIAVNMTESWITREAWQQLAPISAVRAIKLTSLYFAFGAAADGLSTGYTIGLRSQAEQVLGSGYLSAQQGYGVMPLRGRHSLGFMPLTPPDPFQVDNVLSDPWTGTGLLIQGGQIYYYDFNDQVPEIMPYIWRSKIYKQKARKNYEAVKVFFTVPPGTPEQNAVRNMEDPQVLDTGQYGILRVYADGSLFTTREIRQSGELLRVYSGGKYEDWQFEVEARVLVSTVQAATSVKELGAV
jgi:hypothetical protein